MKESTRKSMVWAALALGLALVASVPGGLAQEGYVNEYEVHVEEDHGEAGPQELIRFPIAIDNHSNEDTRFVFEVAEEETPSDFQVVAPAPMVLAGAGADGEPTRGTTTLTVYTPFRNGYVDEDAEITLVIRSHHAEDASLTGETKRVTVSAQAEGFYIPGPGAVLAALAICVAALLVPRW